MLKRPLYSLLLASLLFPACDAERRSPSPEPDRESPSAALPSEPEVLRTAETASAPKGQAAQEAFAVVKEGKARAVLVIPDVRDPEIVAAVETFVQRVRRATGAALQIVGASEEGAADPALARIRIKVAGVNGDETTNALEPESFRIRVVNGGLEIHAAAPTVETKANPRVHSQPLVWALNSLLEQGLGARWLWPGELGTYLPERADLTVSATDTVVQPELEFRVLRLLMSRKRPLASRDRVLNQQLEEEAIRWAVDHRMGSRSEIVFGHNFGHWWERYSKDHPDYFAVLTPNLQQPYPKPGAVKLRLSNPAVIEQIAKEYEEAGAPRYWNVCPNDGSGFDVSPETLAWDIPRGQNPADIVQARGNLTARYVKFWNLLYERLRQINPDVELVTYAYSSYRSAPPAERPLKAKAVLQIVDAADAYDNWRAWTKGGARVFLRPNWWHQGADAPYLRYELNNAFVRFAYDHGMLGIDMDSVLGYWATQGINYYMIARLSYDKTLTDDQLLDEYTEAFGQAAPKIREYLEYWQKLSVKYNYAINAAGGTTPQNSEFQKLVNQKRIPQSILNGSKYALPHLYTDKVLAPALALLDEAAALAGDPAGEPARRVAFLRAGLDSLKATREQVVLGQKLKLDPSPERREAFVEGRKQLEAQREVWSRDHVIWAESTRRYEERYHILLRESAFQRNEINLDGY